MFSEFIREKGVAHLSEVCGISMHAVYNWSRRNRIPREHWDALMRRWPSLKYARLLEMDQASKQAAPA